VEGGGSVVGPDGFDCGTVCEWVYPTRGQQVTLEARPADGWTFGRWAGGCTDPGTCTVVLNGNRSVRAVFQRPLAWTSAPDRKPATMGAAYSDSLRVEGGSPERSWAIVGGRLPEGVALVGDGMLDGIPAEAGEFRFTVRVASGAASLEREFAVAVGKPTLGADAVLEALLGGTPLPADHARFLDLLGNRNGRMDVGDVRAWLVETGMVTPAHRALDTLVGVDR
jgi:hypothetical protein